MTSANMQVGPQTLADGAQNVARANRTGSLIVASGHPRDYEATLRRQRFFSHCTAKTLTAANTTYTGHVIYNSSSSKNLAIGKIFIGVSVTSASMTGIALGYGIQASAPTGLTAATVSGSCFIGDSAGIGLSYAAATLANASTNIVNLIHNTAAIATTGADALVIDLEGGIIIPPGYHVALVALGAASAASAVTSTIFWEETPV